MDPAQIDEQGFEELCLFIRDLSTSLRRSVFVTHENSPEHGIFAYDYETEGFSALHRRSTSGRVAGGIAPQIAAVLDPFNGGFESGGACLEVPTDYAAQSAATIWREKVYRPGCIEWHTELTSDEYRSLQELDTALHIFFGPRDVDDFVRIGFELSTLKQQFWKAVRCVRASFAI